MPDKSMKSDFQLQITIACSWGVAVIALSVLSALGVGDRENVLGVLCATLALGALTAIHVVRKNQRDRESLEKALRESQQRYRHLVERFPGAISVFEERKALYANLAGARLLGAQSVDEILGQDLLGCFDGAESERISSIVANLEGASAARVEQRLVRRDGTTIEVEMEAARFFRDGKEMLQIFIAESVGAKTVERTAEPARLNSSCLERLMLVMQGGR